jgi:hypothetical protein
MAHAGTPTDLAKQPARSSGLWKPLLTSIVILAIGFGLAMTTSFIITNQATSGSAVDRSYDQIETQRGAWALSAVTGNTSYDVLQKAAADKARAMSGVAVGTGATEKAAADKARAMSGVAVDTSYEEIEARRGQSGVTVDTSYNEIEARRGATNLP